MTGYNSDTVRVVLRVSRVIEDPARECVVAIGSTKPLGCWQEENAVTADYIGLSTWQLIIRLPKYQTTYWKWAVMDRNSRKVLHWETRDNRVLEIDNTSFMVNTSWNGEDTVVAIDPSVSETLREKAAAALAEYMESQKKGKNRNACERNSYVFDNRTGINTNTNAGEDLQPSRYSQASVTSRIPVKTSNPTCKGDAYLYNVHKSPDHVKTAYEKPKYRYKKKPIKLLDEACKSEASLDTVDTMLDGLKQVTKGNISRIPVKVKYNKCCNCKFNDIMFSLKASMKSLQEIEDKRTSNLKYSLQDQIPTITDESASLINLDKFQKTLKQELPLKTLPTGSPVREHNNDEDFSFTVPSNNDFSYILPPKLEAISPMIEVSRPAKESPRAASSWSAGLFRQTLSSLIVTLVAVLICKLFLQEFQCPSIVQSECMFSLW